jgi:hypothetical protein
MIWWYGVIKTYEIIRKSIKNLILKYILTIFELKNLKEWSKLYNFKMETNFVNGLKYENQNCDYKITKFILKNSNVFNHIFIFIFIEIL